MYAIKRNGNGQTICAGCLAQDKYAVNWDSMLVELHYDSGTFVGNYCSECLATIKKHYTVEEKTNGTKRVSN